MQNHFSLFELPQSFDLDAALLEKKYFAAQMRFHPDRMVGKNPEERQNSIRQSMIINEAYETLKNPLKRAQHLLQLEGIAHDSIQASQPLLMEIMELRESLMEASTIAEVDAISRNNEEAIDGTLGALSKAFNTKNITEAGQLVLRLSYLVKLGDEIRIKKKSLA